MLLQTSWKLNAVLILCENFINSRKSVFPCVYEMGVSVIKIFIAGKKKMLIEIKDQQQQKKGENKKKYTENSKIITLFSVIKLINRYHTHLF